MSPVVQGRREFVIYRRIQIRRIVSSYVICRKAIGGSVCAHLLATVDRKGSIGEVTYKANDVYRDSRPYIKQNRQDFDRMRKECALTDEINRKLAIILGVTGCSCDI